MTFSPKRWGSHTYSLKHIEFCWHSTYFYPEVCVCVHALPLFAVMAGPPWPANNTRLFLRDEHIRPDCHTAQTGMIRAFYTAEAVLHTLPWIPAYSGGTVSGQIMNSTPPTLLQTKTKFTNTQLPEKHNAWWRAGKYCKKSHDWKCCSFDKVMISNATWYYMPVVSLFLTHHNAVYWSSHLLQMTQY